MAESDKDIPCRSSSNGPQILEQTIVTTADTPSETNEAPEEPVTEEILLWQALMKETESKEVTHRWYFKNKTDKKFNVPGSSIPLRPETVTSDGETSWQAMLPLKGVPIGWYWLVFCVSWKDLNFDTLESVEFDARTGDMDGQTYLMDNLVKTILSKEDLQDIPKNDFTRLRLHRQIRLDDSVGGIYPKITITTTIGPETTASFQLHYLELGSTNFRSSSGDKDVVIYGNDRPNRFIRIGASSPEPVSVSAFSFSELGNYAVTFYLTTGMGHIDVWDLCGPIKKKLRGKPQPITLPLSSHSFEVAEEAPDPYAPGDLFFSVAISGSGSQVAFSSNADMGDDSTLSLAVFECNPTAPADHDLTKPWPLKRSMDLCKDLVNTCGHITFRSTSPETSREQDERFFKFDGAALEIYSTHGKWNRIFVLSTKTDWMAKFLVANALFHSIRGRLFVNTGIKGLVSVWDYEAGKIISNISVPEDNKTVWACLSRDGAMVAVAVKGEIHVHDVATTIKIGVYKKGLYEDNRFEMDFGQEYFMTNNYGASNSGYPGQPNARSIVRVSDMSIVRTFKCYDELELQTPQANGEPIFAFSQGSIVNIHGFGDLLSPVEDSGCDIDCETALDVPFQTIFPGTELDFTSNDGAVFTAKGGDVYEPGASYTTLTIAVEGDDGAVTQEGVICLGNARYYHQVFYVPESSQLFILTSCYLHVWDLVVTDTSICELAYVWKLQEYDEEHADDYAYRSVKWVKTCVHGQRVQITLSANTWLRAGVNLGSGSPDLPNDIVTIPISSADTIKISEEDRLVQGVPVLLSLYAGCDTNVRESIVRYLKNHIHPSVKHPESSLVTISRAWTTVNKTSLEAIVSRLLPPKRITWIPDMNSTKNTNPIAILLSKAETQPRVVGLLRVILNYCVSHASRTKNLAFMGPIFASMHELMELFPEEAQECVSGISYSPAKQRSFVMDNHIIAHPPEVFLKFWRSKKTKSLAKTKHPILQLNSFPSEPGHKNNAFQGPLFTASFDMLWTYNDINIAARMDGPSHNTWWKPLYYMLTLKLRPKTLMYVKCHNLNLVHDDPALAALVAYKWNTIGFMYWSFRYTFQLILCILVIAAALLQVYHDTLRQSQVIAVFISIIVLGMTFLWLELLQAIKYGKRYRTIYNFLDILGYTVPVGTSIQQLVVLHENNPNGYTKTLSFAVLVVSLHALFELRVFKSVCRWVSMIQHTVAEIRAFFFIFAAGIVAFSIAILHLSRACPVLEGCKELTTKFTSDFLRALSTTYFFMGGMYDPVKEEFESEGWEFHLVMAVYFFFTVIVMLNVLIALINVAYTKSDDSWHLVWHEFRLRYIEAAENMSYDIPGFRQSHNWFPKEIYYSATLQEVRAYREKYDSKAFKNKDCDLREDWGWDDDEEEDEDQGAARTRKLGASQGEDNASWTSVNGEAEKNDKEDGNENGDENEEDGDDDDGGDDEEVVDVHGDEDGLTTDQEEDKADASAVKDLKRQVVKLQRQVSRQLKAQQLVLEQSQRQLQELRELLLAQNRT